MTLHRGVLAILALVALAVAGVGASGAGFTSSSQNPGNAVSAAPDWTAPDVSLDNPGTPLSGTVALTTNATDARSSVDSVSFQRRPAGGGNWTEIGADAQAPYRADWSTAQAGDGSYDLRAVATDSEGNAGNSAVVAARVVDNTAPTATLANPGSPLSGTVGLDVTANDAGSGVARVTISYSPAGAGSWTEIGSVTQAPYRVDWNTAQLADGGYDLRATVIDEAGNTVTSATVANRAVDNTGITLADPGDYLRGTASFSATVQGTGAQRVDFQARPTGTSSWSTFASDSSSPYAASFNTTTASDGTYEIRAVATMAGGATETSAVHTVTVDNTAPTGSGVQGAPKSGGTAGRIESGDALTLTFGERMDPNTLISGWTGSPATTVYARLVHASGGNGDRLEFFRNSGATQTTGLGMVSTGGNFIDSGSTVTFASTASLNAQGTAVTITLGTASGNTSGLNTVGGNTTLRWTPSSAARDMAGNAASTALLTESGTADRDF